METTQKQYKLYLPEGVLDSDRIRLILQFVKTHDIMIRVIPHKHLSSDSIGEEHENDSVHSASLDEISPKDGESKATKIHVSHRFSDMEKMFKMGSTNLTDDDEPHTPTLPRDSDDIRLPLTKSKTIFNKRESRGSFEHNIDKPCLMVTQQLWIFDPTEIYRELKGSHEFSTELIPEDIGSQIELTIKHISRSVDVYVRKVLAYVDKYTGSEAEDNNSFLKAKSKSRIGKFSNHMKSLYECLDHFEKNLLPAGQFLNGNSFLLSDLYLFVSLRRPFQLLFDPKVRKFWLPNLTSWFERCKAMKETQAIYSDFELCEVSYLQKIEQTNEPSLPEINRSKSEDITPVSLRTTIAEFIRLRNSNVTLDRSFEGFYDDLKLGDIPEKDYSLWSFKYLSANEELFQGEYFSRKLNGSDEVEDFIGQFTTDIEAVGKSTFVVYLLVYGRCEEMKSVFSLGKQKLQECDIHHGQFYVKKECAGFVITSGTELPKVIRTYEQRDLIEVKPIEERKTFLRQMLLPPKEDDSEFERVFLQQVI
jgi:hypothetical protein